MAQGRAQDRIRRLSAIALNSLEGLLNAEDKGLRFKVIQMLFEVCPPFPDPGGVSVQSTAPDDFRKSAYGVAVEDGVQEQIQEALQILEGFLAGELSAGDVEALLDMEDITPEETESLISDSSKA